MNHIELFAGCGGLSLGLEKAGFNLVLANELSPMAAETFAYNFFGEDLENYAVVGRVPESVKWLSSKYDTIDISKRLRENPFQFPGIDEGFSDIDSNIESMKGKLVVGSIVELNKLLEKRTSLRMAIRDGYGAGGIDLVSGGPPCQSFSMAGLRKKDCDKNVLPWEFAKFVKMIKPRFAVLENVTGILRAFTEGGVRYHAWFEVAKAFAEIGYVPLCLHVNARLAGVPQNRPRFLMIGARLDFYRSLRPNLNDSEKLLFSYGEKFVGKVRKNPESVGLEDLKYFDVLRDKDLDLMKKSFLSDLVIKNQVSVKDALDDIKFSNPSGKSRFVKSVNREFSFLKKRKEIFNHEPRNNSDSVRRRFRIYQIIKKCSKATEREALQVLKGMSSELSERAWGELREYRFLLKDGSYKLFRHGEKSNLIEFFHAHTTKKRTQNALDSKLPAPAALSIPDDACHYDEAELRTLTVREMARIQSFPDDFVFRSKVTTGGQMRRYEVPQYTQVGNAVPPLLGLAVGNALANLLIRV
ncbi:DNA cytosine methyltransferase [Gilvimarinus sp. 1_MG-2023]|uniref:DNA cytosine methyltransferase n=1 Tax=Gilvimarinus sp. 1_MG-2023 TaxID=3062638 RepID=UPI0026E2AADB|nr:DNA cytosine methyltransferase [Gilvimarinus sp. 1_MG-2023]MDO6748049.1 DNA cytosine methyltransferase [Gilvimarinus sp. 1_MG-2023]